MSPSVFYGAQQVSQTVHEYDDDGRLTASTTTYSAAWDDRDRELALAVEDELAIRCGECGHPLDETTDQTDPLVRWEVDRDAVMECKACAAQDKYVASLSGDQRQRLHVMKIPVRKTRLEFDDDDE